MRVRILDEAQSDLRESAQFYEQQSDGLGLYFLDTLFSDIRHWLNDYDKSLVPQLNRYVIEKHMKIGEFAYE